MAFELLFLGTGTSAGVPMIACDCAVCRSDDPRDKRSRASVLIRYPDATADAEDPEAVRRQLLIDTGPDLRDQALRHDLRRLDGVLYTHAHGDHIFGIDELRRFNAVMKAPLDIYAEAEVMQKLHHKFDYIFEPHKNINQSFVPQLISHVIAPEVMFELFGATWTPIRLMHGRLPIVGYRVDYEGHSLAYCTDVSAVPPESFPLLQGLDVLVLDGLRYRHHPTHLTVDQALAIIDQLQPAPEMAYLTHIAHDIDHADLSARLPDGVALAYDGLSVQLGEKENRRQKSSLFTPVPERLPGAKGPDALR